MITDIAINSLEIIQNPFGNYAIQHIVDEWGPSKAKEIFDIIISNIVSLSMQKFSSNVIEKCFDCVDQVKLIILIIIIIIISALEKEWSKNYLMLPK